MQDLSISQAKRKLKKAGFYDGPIDEEVTKEFVAAVKEAQKKLGTFPDGLYGPQTDSLLDIYLAKLK